MHKKNKITGFTIVELIVVIAVIGILAGISLVVYGGMRRNAVSTVLTTDLRNAATALENSNIKKGEYPLSESAANDGMGISKSPGTIYTYVYTPEDNSYCLSAKSTQDSSAPSYAITNQKTSPYPGACQYGPPIIARTSAHGASYININIIYKGNPKIIIWQRSTDPTFQTSITSPAYTISSSGNSSFGSASRDYENKLYYFRFCGSDVVGSITCTTGLSNTISTDS